MGGEADFAHVGVGHGGNRAAPANLTKHLRRQIPAGKAQRRVAEVWRVADMVDRIFHPLSVRAGQYLRVDNDEFGRLPGNDLFKRYMGRNKAIGRPEEPR